MRITEEDLYYLSNVFSFDRVSVLQTLENSKKTLESFQGFLHRIEDLKHSYDKFRFSGDIDKPSFEEVYGTVKSFIKDILPKE